MSVREPDVKYLGFQSAKSAGCKGLPDDRVLEPISERSPIPNDVSVREPDVKYLGFQSAKSAGCKGLLDDRVLLCCQTGALLHPPLLAEICRTKRLPGNPTLVLSYAVSINTVGYVANPNDVPYGSPFRLKRRYIL